MEKVKNQDEIMRKKFLEENIFDVNLYDKIYLVENHQNYKKCCEADTVEEMQGIADRYGKIQMIRYCKCKKCGAVYVRCPTYYIFSPQVQRKMIPDEFSKRVFDNIEEWGVPIRENSLYAEELTGGLHIYYRKCYINFFA